MATEEQKYYIKSLYEQIGQEVESDLDELTKMEAHRLIQELLELRNEVE